MSGSNEISNELASISKVLQKVPRVNVFRVPDGYFDHLEERITTHTLMHRDEFLFEKGEELMKVPEGYFDSLSDLILSKIKAGTEGNEKDELSNYPILSSLRGKNVFTVPDQYFEHLPGTIINKNISKPAQAKVVSMGAKWWRYAAAVIITGIIAFGSLQLFNNSADEPVSYAYEVAKQFNTPEQFEKGVASLSDEEIINYLESGGSILDNELLMTGTENELPSAFDYLLDENTLNNYLDLIDAGNSN